MREFFRGWKRKLGCVTLLMACISMGLDMRSRLVRDQLSYWIGATHLRIASDSGAIRFASVEWPGSTYEGHYVWPRFEIADRPTGNHYDEYWARCEMAWRVSVAGFDFGKGTITGYQKERWVFPYWSLTILITLISAALLSRAQHKLPKEPPDA